MSKNVKETVIQFGEGGFLRGFVDYFFHKLQEKGLYDGKIVVVQPIEKGMCQMLSDQNCEYNLFLRGIDNGQVVNCLLYTSFRQAAQSDIVVNAHKINAGEPIDLAKRSQDFLFIRRDNPDSVISAAITLIQKKLPDYVHANAFDIQVMTPMRKGALGVERLNQIMQNLSLIHISVESN